ncbi:ATP-binding cassette domain-containing protein [Hydrogenibacillus schlegelii]|uniref:ABC transporter ATP-binding protein n=1 Tax=Hydrogenibacillus schlegelii TaxID=1484 RepID=A0A132MH15_HYDSH|nr:ATP-binding cassette domain-containing protein [Hydrogenibacillus schlegelii]KWW96711.1 ABC transporter ATP-binding protein [Hydrogenibacillus schlegelii]OAR05336.1 ABC transporter ATP-binding protein [Hydrogenibacillus schlegelii]
MLRLVGVSKIYNAGTSDEKAALKGIDLDVREGELVTIIGSNGAGKSTLLNVIAGTITPDEGHIVLDGTDITDWPEHRRSRWIARVFQDPAAGTAPNMTIEENLALALARDGRRTFRRGVTDERRQAFRERVRQLGIGLENRLGVKVGALSGGERQALALLMATLCRPKLLLLDEHTAALDPKRAAWVSELTVGLIRELKLTALMVTHNMKQAIEMGDRLIMMDEGEVILTYEGEAKRSLTVERLLQSFERVRGSMLDTDRAVLA